MERKVFFKGFITILMSLLLVVVLAFFACAEELYICNLPDGSISVIDSNDHPNPISKRHIAGADTLLTGPDVFGMYLYNNELFVANDAAGVLLVFDASADKNVKPKRKISGLNQPRGVVISGGELFVGDTVSGKGQIKVFDLKAKDPAITKRVISCDYDEITLGEVWAMAVSGSELFVSDGSKIFVFDAASNLNTRPKRVIEHKSDAFSVAYGLDVDANNVYVSDAKNRIMVFPISSNGAVEPIATISGAATQLKSPYSLMVKGKYIYSSQYSGGKIHVFKTTDNREVEPQWSYTSTDFPGAWMIAVEKNSYVRPSEHQQSGVNVSIVSNAENATTDTVLQSVYRTPSNFQLRAPLGSFTATVDSNGANGVFRFNSTNLSGTTNNVRLYKCFETNGTSIPFGSYSTAVDPDTEGTWWLEDDNGNYIDPGNTLTEGTNYWVNYVVKDNGIYDEDRTLGSIKDPAALGAVNRQGCVMNPAAGLGLEWLLLAFATIIGLIARK